MNQNSQNNRKKAEQRQTARMQAPLGERQIVTELSEDFDLPDYQPEIKRLLRVQARTLTSAREMRSARERWITAFFIRARTARFTAQVRRGSTALRSPWSCLLILTRARG